MTNILEFFIKMRDFSPPVIAKTVQNVQRIEQATTKASARVQGVTDRLRTIGATDPSASAVKGFEKMTNEARKLNSELEKTGGGGSGGLLGKLAKWVTVGAIATGVLAFGKSSAQAYIDFEKNSKSYEVLSGNKGVGQALAGDLNDLKQNSILGASVYGNAKTLMSFGITADKILPTLKMLGEVSMGDADRFQSLTLAFAQTQSAGKLMGQDLLQYVNAGFNPLHEISVMTGESMGNLRKKMEQGAISAQQVQKAFEHATGQGGLFNGMLQQMGETTSGKIANLNGKVAALKIAIGERMAPAINSFLGGLTGIVMKLKSWIEIPISQKINEQIGKIRGLQAELTSSNTAHTRQLEILKELEAINPNITKGIDDQNISYAKLAENINNVTGALQKKIFLDTFTKDNASTLTSYASAQEKYNKNWAESFSIIGTNFPDLAQRTDMTFGQKQAEAQARLAARVKADPNKGTKAYTDMEGNTTQQSYGDLRSLEYLRLAIKNSNEANSVIQSLAPKVNEINATKDALSKQIDQYTGVKSMTAAQISNNGGSTSGTTSSAGTGVASGITGGGPRVINISGVNMKLADKIDVHAMDSKDFLNQLEPQMEEFWLRLLNSGASIQ